MHQTPTTRIHQNAVKAWRITAALYGLFWLTPSALYFAIAIAEGLERNLEWQESIDWPLFGIITTIAVIFYLLNAILYPRLRWKRWKYDVSDDEIDMLRGIIITKRTLVPINRVQHVDTRQGPIYRQFGLSSVTISTAATTHEIPALDDTTADELRNTISTLVRKVKDDV